MATVRMTQQMADKIEKAAMEKWETANQSLRKPRVYNRCSFQTACR